ncbi:MAG: glycosyltransferase family 1 protein [bacterium]
MLIAIDARFYGTENTGLGRYTQNVLAHFFEKDDTNEYIVFVTPKYARLIFPGRVKVVPINVRHYTLAEQLVIPYLLLKYRAELLYTLHFNAPIFCPVPLVITIHDLIKTHFQDIATSTHGHLAFAIKRWGYRTVMGAVIANAKNIIVPSVAVKSDILTAYPDAVGTKIIPIHEAVDSFFVNSAPKIIAKPKIFSSLFNLLFVGNAYPHKNLTNLLSAFTILRREGDYHLTILSKKTPFLASALKKLNPIDRPFVAVDEDVSDKALLRHYTTTGVLVVPSFMEGFGLPALEALSVGTPVAASDIPVFREVYGKHVTYFNPFDALSMVKGIKQALGNGVIYQYPRTWGQVATEIRKVLL